MECPKCQSANPSDALFCNRCGKELEVICRECNNPNPPGSLFCNKCRNNFYQSKDASPIDYSEPISYTPRFLSEKILTTRSAIEGERKLVTVFFADVANYTGLSEKLDPEEVHQIMDGAFEILINEIHRHEGTINQFTGDGVMALFGAPISHEDHAQRACHAAIAIQKQINSYGKKIKKDCDVEFRMRIGLNSGHVIVGSIGDDLRMDYTAVGDTTNLSARMESLAKPGTILISKNTYKLVKDYFEFNPLGEMKIKGKEEPQEVFELIKPGEIETRIHAAAAKGLTRFVGRKNSIPALLEPLENVKTGSGQVAGVVGEAGVGKSRILLELHKRLPEEEYTWMEGRCLHYGGSMAYLPIHDVLRSYFDVIDGDREYIIKKKIRDKMTALDEKLGSTVAPFQELFSVTVDDEAYAKLEPQQKRERTFEALRNLFLRESQNNPLVLVIEDMHWIDNTSQEFANYLIDWLANSRIFLILVYRPEYTHQWGSKSYYTKVGLTQLGTASSTELVQAILEDAEIVPELRDLVLDKAGGNPLFMEEFTQTLLENGSIRKADDKYLLSEKPENIQVPDTIQGIISARMDRLEDNLKRTMQVASVIGRDFAFRILHTITGMREDLKSSLMNLQGLEFIYEKNLFPELEYIFKHVLIQEVAYNSLLQTKRKKLHENIGEAIEQIYADRLEEFYEMLAYHFSKSENHFKAYQYLKLSGEKAYGNYANLEAFNFYNQAIDKLNQLPDTAENKKFRIEICLLAYGPTLVLSFPDKSLEVLKEGERLSKELGDERSLAKFFGGISFYYAYEGDSILGKKYAEKGFYEAQKIQDIELMVPLSFGLSETYSATGEYSTIANIIPDVIAFLEKNSEESECFGIPFSPYSYFCGLYGYSIAYLGNFKKGTIFLEKGLRFAVKHNDPYLIGVIEFYFGYRYMFQSDGKNCTKHFQNSLKYCEKTNAPFLVAQNLSGLAWGHYLLDEFEEAQNLAEKGYKIQTDCGIARLMSVYPTYLSFFYYETGHFAQAQKHAEKALELSQAMREQHMIIWSKLSLGRILGRKGHSSFDTAKETIIQGVKLAKELRLKPIFPAGYFLLGELYANAGQKEKAIENLKKAEALCQEMNLGLWPGKIEAVLDRL